MGASILRVNQKLILALVLLINFEVNAAIFPNTFRKPIAVGEWIVVQDDSELGDWLNAQVTEVTEEHILAEVDYQVHPVDVKQWRTRRLSGRKQRRLNQIAARDTATLLELVEQINAAGGRAEPAGYTRRFVRIFAAPGPEFLNGVKFYSEKARSQSIFNNQAYVNALIAEVESQGGILTTFERTPTWKMGLAIVHGVGGVGPMRRAPNPGEPIFALAITKVTDQHTVNHERVHIADFLNSPAEVDLLGNYVANARSPMDRLRNYGIRLQFTGELELRAVERSNPDLTFDRYSRNDQLHYMVFKAVRARGNFLVTPSVQTLNQAVRDTVAVTVALQRERLPSRLYRAKRMVIRYGPVIACGAALGLATANWLSK